MEEANKPMLQEVVRLRIRLKHYSHRIEKSYIHWIRHFVRFHNRQHPRNLGKPDIEALLTYLAVDRKVSASTQNQALMPCCSCTGKCWKCAEFGVRVITRSFWAIEAIQQADARTASQPLT